MPNPYQLARDGAVSAISLVHGITAVRVSRDNISRFSDSVLPIRQREIDRTGGVIG